MKKQILLGAVGVCLFTANINANAGSIGGYGYSNKYLKESQVTYLKEDYYVDLSLYPNLALRADQNSTIGMAEVTLGHETRTSSYYTQWGVLAGASLNSSGPIDIAVSYRVGGKAGAGIRHNKFNIGVFARGYYDEATFNDVSDSGANLGGEAILGYNLTDDYYLGLSYVYDKKYQGLGGTFKMNF